MIFTASGATRLFNGRVVKPLETELHGSFELSYMAPFDYDLCGSLISELLDAY